MEKVCLKIVYGYCLLSIINAFLGIVHLEGLKKFDIVIMLAGTVLAISYLVKKRTTIDLFVLSFAFITVAISSLQGYEHELWYSGVRTQIWPMMFFFVGRHRLFTIGKMMYNSFLPYIFITIVGFYLFVTVPSWYVAFKSDGLNSGANAFQLMEMARFSAIWVFPYWVSFFSALLYLFVVSSASQNGFLTKKELFFILYIIIIVILTQQRAPLAAMVVCTIVCLTKSKKSRFYRDYKSFSLVKSIFVLLGILILIFLFALRFIDTDVIDFVKEKYVVFFDSLDFAGERISMYDEFKKISISFFGDGIGRYSHLAIFMGKPGITDQQYLRALYEQGIFGLTMYFILFLVILLRGFRHYRIHFFEVFVVLFYLIAMMGANCLSQFDQHNIILWLCCGSIFKNIKFSNQYDSKNNSSLLAIG